MRIILIIFGISLAIVLSMGYGMRYISPPYQSIATNFFISVEKKEYIDAYDLFSTNFKRQTAFRNFAQFIDHSEYQNYKEGDWFNIVVEQDKGTIQGVITLKSGKKIPLTFSFVAEKDPKASNIMPRIVTKVIGDLTIWKIDGIRETS